jgi:hypothetical protein
MADTFTPGTADQSVPTGQDKYDVAPPNYRQIGQALAAGQADYQAQTKDAVTGISDFIAHPLDTLLTWIATALAWFLSKILCVVAFLMQVITSVDDAAAPGMQAVIKNSLGHVFGLETGSTGRKVGQSVDSKIQAKAVGDMVINALKAGVPASSGKTLQPDDTAAANFLAMTARLGIEGWIDGFVAEAIGGEHLQSVLELVPIMNQVLGLGRLSRRALAPLVKILVADPYTWKLHLQYRPALWPEALALRQYIRGKLTSDQLDDALGRHGMSADQITALKDQATKELSTGDYEYLVAHGYISSDQYSSRLQNEGWPDGPRQQLANLPEQRLINEIALKRWELYSEAFVRGDLTDGELTDAVNTLSFSQAIKGEMEASARAKRTLGVKHLTLGDVEKMIKAHIMNLDDLRTWMTRENYPIDEQVLLELYLLGQISDADQAKAAKVKAQTARDTAAAARAQKQADTAAAAAAKLDTKGVSTATFEALVESGARTFEQFQDFLKLQGLQPGPIADLVELLHEKITAKENAAAAHAALAAAAVDKHLPLASIEGAVIAGTIPMDDLTTFMKQQHYTDADISIATNYVQGKIDTATATAAAKQAAAAAAQVKGITLPNLERAARLGLATQADYAAALTAAGYDAHSVDLMAGLLADQIASDQAALATRKAAAAAAAKKNISLPQLEQAVIAGLQPMSAYQAQLVELGYDPADVSTLVNLLQLQVDTAAHIAATKAAAAAKLATKDLSLTEIERAVKLGVLTIDVYRAHLAAVGYSADDVDVLAASLLAELAATKAAHAKQGSVSGELAARGVSLAQEQALVRDGLSTLDAYFAFLRAQGYAADTAAQLTQLFSDELDQAATAAAKHELAAARAAQKNISLASEEKAVVDGIRTMDDYDALLVTLGFNDVDQATLNALLEKRLPAPAAAAA